MHPNFEKNSRKKLPKKKSLRNRKNQNDVIPHHQTLAKKMNVILPNYDKNLGPRLPVVPTLIKNGINTTDSNLHL